MAAPIGSWIRYKSSSVLLKLLANKAVSGPKVRYTIPLKCFYPVRPLAPAENGYMSLSRALFSGFSTKSTLLSQSQTGRSARGMSNGSGDDEDKLPLRLMDFQERIWPHPFKTMKNLLLAFLIRGYFDEQFTPDRFLKGVEQAAGYVSGLISVGDFDALEEVMDREHVREIRRYYGRLSQAQREFVAIDKEDLFMKFIYEIGMIFDDNQPDSRFVEITAILQGFHGLGDAKKEYPDSYTEIMQREKYNMFVCNYRLIRNYTKGVEDDWTINKLNHFLPVEIVDKTKWFDR